MHGGAGAHARCFIRCVPCLVENDAGVIPILTIGYGSRRTADEFVELLHRHGVQYLADVRSRPYSKYRPEFSKDALAAILKRGGIAYVHMGDSLGGMPEDPACRTNGKVDYAKVRRQEWFIRGLERLETGRRGGHRIAIMCAELEPHRCHRARLVGEALAARGVPLGHIDEEGSIITHDEVMERIDADRDAMLFDEG